MQLHDYTAWRSLCHFSVCLEGVNKNFQVFLHSEVELERRGIHEAVPSAVVTLVAQYQQ